MYLLPLHADILADIPPVGESSAPICHSKALSPQPRPYSHTTKTDNAGKGSAMLLGLSRQLLDHLAILSIHRIDPHLDVELTCQVNGR